ncbi:MAG TPA: Fic family protein [Rhabdochlamydiaceae bacterium]|jgi:Fic family protein
MSFVPEKLPLKSLNKTLFSHQLRKADKALHAFDKLLQTAPKPQLLFSSLSYLESLAALESQKIFSPLEDFLLLSHKHSHKKKKLIPIICYHTALKRACRSIYTTTLSKDLICKAHNIIKKGAPRPYEVGHYRTKQNWIGPEGCTREEASFFPPAHTLLNSTMRNLLSYCNSRKRKDPLLHVAIAVAQFLILHPFMDGNGRVGRILVPLLFYKQGILSHPLLFFSRYLKDHRRAYFRRLFAITGQHQWEQWVLFFSKGVVSELKKEQKKAEQIYKLYQKLHAKLQPQSGYLFFLFSQPLFSRAQFLKRYSRPLLRQLESHNIITPYKKSYYTFAPLLKILKNKSPER